MGAPSYNNFRNLITFSRGTNATLFDSTGKLTFGANNLLVNTATLSTQTVNTNLIAGCDVILSFKGTGSVAISGGFTGTLAGTGASDRVSLKFTTTTTSLTFTVTGTVTEAQLERVTYQTTPSTYNASTASQFFGPRLDYDPVTLALRGMLVEEQRINLQAYSDAINLWSSNTSVVISANATTSPDGTANADKLSSDTTGSGFYAQNLIAISSAVTYTASVYLKAAEVTSGIVVSLGTGALWPTGSNPLVTVNLASGTITSTNNVLSSSITNVGNGWYRVAFTQTSSGAGNSGIRITPTGVAGTGTSGIFVWGAQLEAGAFATSYIPTDGNTRTRNADVATMSGSQFTPWYNGTQGTLVVQADTVSINNAATFALGTTTSDLMRGFRQTDFQPVFQVLVGGAPQATIGLGNTNWPQASVVRMATAYAASNFAASVGGNAAVSATSGSVPTVSQLSLGSSPGLGNLNGHIRSITYYPRRLSNTQLQRLTA